MDQPNETIIRKIQALFALGTSSNEHEASLAMAKAQELLAKYNLDMAVLNEAGKKTVGEGREKRTINKSAMYHWQKELWSTLAECNFCWHFITHEREEYKKRYSYGLDTAYRKVKRHRIIGRQSNVVAVQLMGEYLCETIERILPYANKDRLSNAALSWRQGCSDRLRARILESYRAARAQDVTKGESGNSTALALVSITDAEYAGNYDFLYGEGAWARAKDRQAAYSKQYEEDAKATALALANETPAQKKAREDKEAKDAARWHKAAERMRKEEAKRMDNMDWSAYSTGQDAGNKISLNDQLGSNKSKELK